MLETHVNASYLMHDTVNWDQWRRRDYPILGFGTFWFIISEIEAPRESVLPGKQQQRTREHAALGTAGSLRHKSQMCDASRLKEKSGSNILLAWVRPPHFRMQRRCVCVNPTGIASSRGREFICRRSGRLGVNSLRSLLKSGCEVVVYCWNLRCECVVYFLEAWWVNSLWTVAVLDAIWINLVQNKSRVCISCAFSGGLDEHSLCLLWKPWCACILVYLAENTCVNSSRTFWNRGCHFVVLSLSPGRALVMLFNSSSLGVKSLSAFWSPKCESVVCFLKSCAWNHREASKRRNF